MFRFTESLSVAMAVMEIAHSIIESTGSRHISGCTWLECMDNGREQGLSLYYTCNGDFVKFMVCQCRRSDSITIYESERYGSNTPNDEEYHNSVTFSYNQPYEAADYIAEKLKNRGNDDEQ